jgi:polyisoprenoid-binding protein YceI
MRAPALCLLGWAVACPALAEPVIYRLDPEHSFVHFEVLHFGTSTLRGRFGPLEGSVELDRAAGSGFVALRIATASISTGLPVFDARLREPDLLATDAYPEAQFMSTRFYFDGPMLTGLQGDLKLRDASQRLELRALHFGCRMDARLQREVCGGDFEGEVRRGDFGASFGMPFVDNRVRLRVQVEGIRQ